MKHALVVLIFTACAFAQLPAPESGGSGGGGGGGTTISDPSEGEGVVGTDGSQKGLAVDDDLTLTATSTKITLGAGPSLMRILESSSDPVDTTNTCARGTLWYNYTKRIYFACKDNSNTWMRLSGTAFTGEDAGGDDTYVVAPLGFPAVYETGQVIVLTAATANTGVSTLDAGPGAKSILRPGDVALSDGDIAADTPTILKYDAAANSAAGAWVIPPPASGGAASGFRAYFPASSRGASTNNVAGGWNAVSTANVGLGITGPPAITGIALDASTAEEAYLSFRLPSSYSSDTVTVKIDWVAVATGTNAAVIDISTVCVADGESLSSPTFNAAQSGTYASSGNSTKNTLTLTPLTMTGCAAGEWMFIKVARDATNGSDTLVADFIMLGLEFSY